MGSLTEKWNEGLANTTLPQRLIEKIRPDAPVKNKVSFAQKKLQLQVEKLEEITTKLQVKHDYIFKKIVDAQTHNNVPYARAYAIELHEIRKMKSMVTNAKLSMEQIQIRLNTISSLGDVVVTLSPCMSVIKGLGTSLQGILPQANASFSDLSKTLGEILSGSTVTGNRTLAPDTSSAETLAILEEAQSVIEGHTRKSMPEPPTALAKEIHEETLT